MRLDKAIASQGTFSRKEVRELVRKGKVSVDGAVLKDPGANVQPDCQNIVVNGTPLGYKEHVYYMLNKPKGTISATEDRTQKTVLDLVPKELYREGLFPAGRLDADTTGFVLLTDDGAFAHDVLSPRHHVEKTYVVTLADPVTEPAMEQVRQGITLKDGTVCRPAVVTPLDETRVEVRIVEGKYHQIKRMFAATGNKVVELTRRAIGPVELDASLRSGELRELTETELNLLKRVK